MIIFGSSHIPILPLLQGGGPPEVGPGFWGSIGQLTILPRLEVAHVGIVWFEVRW